MEYRGKQYSVLQRLDTMWKWSKTLGASRGTEPNRAAGIRAAERAIDKALAPKKRPLVPPG
jgi:hypothetical protein